MLHYSQRLSPLPHHTRSKSSTTCCGVRHIYVLLLMLGAWFDSKSLGKIGRDFRKRSRSAGRRAARERWHAGHRMAAATDLLRRVFLRLDFKAVVVIARLACGLDRRPVRGGE